MTSMTMADKASNPVYQAMFAVEKALRKSSLEGSLRELIKMRVSQINGCSYCLDMHWKDARAAGETEQRLYSLPAWRECPYYSQRERVALLFAEEFTRVADRHVAEEAYELAQATFSDQELSDLAWAVATINTWNRVNIALRTVPGGYQPIAGQQY